MAKIAIIVGSIREGRIGAEVAQWVACSAISRSIAYDVLDLKNYPLPLMDSAVIPAQADGHYGDAAVQKFANKLKDYVGYIFVSPEYNHNIPGPFKNAFDSIGKEWMGKPVAIVAYGFGGAADAITGWRMSTTGKLAMQFVEETTNIDLLTNLNGTEFSPTDEVADALQATLAGLEAKLEKKK